MLMVLQKIKFLWEYQKQLQLWTKCCNQVVITPGSYSVGSEFGCIFFEVTIGWKASREKLCSSEFVKPINYQVLIILTMYSQTDCTKRHKNFVTNNN